MTELEQILLSALQESQTQFEKAQQQFQDTLKTLQNEYDEIKKINLHTMKQATACEENSKILQRQVNNLQIQIKRLSKQIEN